MVRVIPATAELLERAMGEPLQRSTKAIALVRAKDGEVVGCAGIFPEDNRLVIFSKLTDEARACPRAIITGYRRLLELADQSPLPLHALPDPDVPLAERFLEHMGFRQIAETCWERQPQRRTA